MASKALEIANKLALQENQKRENSKKENQINDSQEDLDKSLISWENALTIFSKDNDKSNNELMNFLSNNVLDEKIENQVLIEDFNKLLAPILDSNLGTKIKPMVITFDKTSAEMIQAIGEDKKEKPSIINSQDPNKIIKNKEDTSEKGFDLKQLLSGMNTILSKLLNPVAFFTSIIAEFLPYFILGFFFFKGFLNEMGIDIMNIIKPGLAILAGLLVMKWGIQAALFFTGLGPKLILPVLQFFTWLKGKESAKFLMEKGFFVFKKGLELAIAAIRIAAAWIGAFAIYAAIGILVIGILALFAIFIYLMRDQIVAVITKIIDFFGKILDFVDKALTSIIGRSNECNRNNWLCYYECGK